MSAPARRLALLAVLLTGCADASRAAAPAPARTGPGFDVSGDTSFTVEDIETRAVRLFVDDERTFSIRISPEAGDDAGTTRVWLQHLPVGIGPGEYPLGEPSLSPGDGAIAAFAWVDDGAEDGEPYTLYSHGVEGTLTVTASERGRLSGAFEFRARNGEGRRAREITVTGDFQDATAAETSP